MDTGKPSRYGCGPFSKKLRSDTRSFTDWHGLCGWLQDASTVKLGTVRDIERSDVQKSFVERDGKFWQVQKNHLEPVEWNTSEIAWLSELTGISGAGGAGRAIQDPQARPQMARGSPQ